MSPALAVTSECHCGQPVFGGVQAAKTPGVTQTVRLPRRRTTACHHAGIPTTLMPFTHR